MRIWFNKTFSSISAVFRNLHNADAARALTIICTHAQPTASAFLFADEHCLEPEDLSGPAYIEWCLAFCRDQGVDLFWPGKEAVLAAEYKHAFEQAGSRVLTAAEPDILKLLQNKADFYADLPSGVAEIMDFVAVETVSGFDRAIAELSARHAKLCVKPAVSAYGLGFRIIDEHAGIGRLLKGEDHHVSLAELRAGMSRIGKFAPLVVMEYLPGPEWSVDCVARCGRLLCAVQRKKPQQPGRGQMIDGNAAIADMVENLTAHYRLSGLYNIQFKQGKGGPRLLEINARPSGGVGMACLAGVNLPYLALQSLETREISIPAIHYGLSVGQIHMPIVLPAETAAVSPDRVP